MNATPLSERFFNVSEITIHNPSILTSFRCRPGGGQVSNVNDNELVLAALQQCTEVQS